MMTTLHSCDGATELAVPRARRRLQPHPEPGARLTVRNPEIKEVFDLERDEFLPVEQVIGTDYPALVQLRLQVRTQMRRGNPIFKCAICGVAVHICKSWKENNFFFKHQHEDGSCPAITKGHLNQQEIDARKYNGLKESHLHIQMKEWLVRCLSADSAFSDVKSEAVWKGAWSAEWRKPDVQAWYGGQRIAFEIQLSTTYLDVIAARRDFYLAEGGLLFWIFARFDTDRLRMTEDDVFYNNNWNAFVVNSNTVEASLEGGAFQLECIWSTPVRLNEASGLKRMMVPFSQLTLDPQSQRAYYFDFDGARLALRELAADQARALREDFEVAFDRGAYYGADGEAIWDEFRRRFARAGVALPRRRSELSFALLQALYSAKLGRPASSKRKRLVEIAHQVASGHKGYMRWFGKALRQWDRGAQLKAEDKSGLWAEKVQACRLEYASAPALYEPDRTHQVVVEFLFPEMKPLP